MNKSDVLAKERVTWVTVGDSSDNRFRGTFELIYSPSNIEQTAIPLPVDEI